MEITAADFIPSFETTLLSAVVHLFLWPINGLRLPSGIWNAGNGVPERTQLKYTNALDPYIQVMLLSSSEFLQSPMRKKSTMPIRPIQIANSEP